MNNSPAKRWQFSVRTILLVTLLIAGLISSISQYGASGLVLFVLGLGVVLLISGVWNRELNRGIVGVMLVLVTAPFFGSATRYVHEVAHPVHVTVTDSQSGQPIRRAKVFIYKASQHVPPYYVATNRDGAATLQSKFRASTCEFGITKDGHMWLWEHMILVEKDGYQSRALPLYELTGKTHELYQDPLPPVRIELAKGQ